MGKPKKNLWRFFAAAGIAAFIGYAAFEAGWTEIAKTIVRGKNVPPEFIGKKIVFVADIHCGEGFPPARLDDLAKQINSLDADIVLFGGDYVSRNGKKHERMLFKACENRSAAGKIWRPGKS